MGCAQTTWIYQDTWQCVMLPKKTGCASYKSIFTGTTKLRFSIILNSKAALVVPTYQSPTYQIQRKSHGQFLSEQVLCFFFIFFFFVFLHTWKHCSNSLTHAPIQLKFGSLVGQPRMIIHTICGENLYKILRIIIHFLHKIRTIFRHVY